MLITINLFNLFQERRFKSTLHYFFWPSTFISFLRLTDWFFIPIPFYLLSFYFYLLSYSFFPLLSFIFFLLSYFLSLFPFVLFLFIFCLFPFVFYFISSRSKLPCWHNRYSLEWFGQLFRIHWGSNNRPLAAPCGDHPVFGFPKFPILAIPYRDSSQPS